MSHCTGLQLAYRDLGLCMRDRRIMRMTYMSVMVEATTRILFPMSFYHHPHGKLWPYCAVALSHTVAVQHTGY